MMWRVEDIEILGSVDMQNPHGDAALAAIPADCRDKDCERAKRIAFYCTQDGLAVEQTPVQVGSETLRQIGAICGSCDDVQISSTI